MTHSCCQIIYALLTTSPSNDTGPDTGKPQTADLLWPNINKYILSWHSSPIHNLAVFIDHCVVLFTSLLVSRPNHISVLWCLVSPTMGHFGLVVDEFIYFLPLEKYRKKIPQHRSCPLKVASFEVHFLLSSSTMI